MTTEKHGWYQTMSRQLVEGREPIHLKGRPWEVDGLHMLDKERT